MDIGEAIVLAESFQEAWGSLTVGTVKQHQHGGERVFTLAFPVEELRVILRLFLGPRGGVRADIYVNNPALAMADQIILAEWLHEHLVDSFIAMRSLKHLLRQNPGDAAGYCSAELMNAMALAQAGAVWFKRHVRERADQPGHSVGTLSGGLPSHGRRA